MPAIMADHDIEGQVRVLLRLLASGAWSEVWHELAVRIETFASLGLAENTSDAALWQFCQTRQIILITGNRNKAGPEALEAVIERNNTPLSLPVLTIGTPPRVLSIRAYAERVATRFLEVLLDVEQYRGTGHLYLP
jgi:predicted nuclease of predicted toxin-antitoxin system